MRKRPEPKPDRATDVEARLNAVLRKRGLFLEKRNFAMRGKRSQKA